MSKINGVLAGLALAAAATFGGAPQVAAGQPGAAQTVVPAAFDVCYWQYRQCMQDGGSEKDCYTQYLICEQEAPPPGPSH